MSNDATVQKEALRIRDERPRLRALSAETNVRRGGAVSTPRRGHWLRRGLLALCVLALLALTLHSLRLSDATFAAASSNSGNVFVAGTLAHTNDRNGQVMITATGLEPGGSRSGTMTLTGAGSLTGAYTLTQASLTNVPVSPALSDKLDLIVEDAGAGEILYEGPVGGFTEAELGDVAPGVTRSYVLTVEYPDGPNDGRLQGAAMTLVLRVTGVSQ
jgi:hypothetical protein